MILPTEVRKAIVAHARFCLPEEACGLLASDDSDRIRMAYCLTNSEHSTNHFTVAPDEHFGALKHAESHGWHISGSFHSHPTSAPEPSRADLAGALDPDWVHLIAGPVGSGPIEIVGYWIRDGVARSALLESEVTV